MEADIGLDAFISRESEGVSANLCEALVKLSPESETGLKISFAWALDIPVMESNPVVAFGVEALPPA